MSAHAPVLSDISADELPRRPRRRLLAPVPVTLLSALLLACGFIGGALLEKKQSTASTGASVPAVSTAAKSSAGFARAGAPGGTSATGSGAQTTSAGEVLYVRNGTLYVKDSEGITIKVNAAANASVTKTIDTKVARIQPGETVSVRGSASSSGTISASSITVGSTGLAAFGIPTSTTGSARTTAKSATTDSRTLFGP